MLALTLHPIVRHATLDGATIGFAETGEEGGVNHRGFQFVTAPPDELAIIPHRRLGFLLAGYHHGWRPPRPDHRDYHITIAGKDRAAELPADVHLIEGIVAENATNLIDLTAADILRICRPLPWTRDGQGFGPACRPALRAAVPRRER
jgi:hypothetical protein